MAKHDVSFSIPQRSLGKAEVEFLVKADGAVFGCRFAFMTAPFTLQVTPSA